MISNSPLAYDRSHSRYASLTYSPIPSLGALEHALSVCAEAADDLHNQLPHMSQLRRMQQHEAVRQATVKKYGLPALADLDKWAAEQLGDRVPVPLAAGFQLAIDILKTQSAEAAASVLRTTLRILVRETQVGHLTMDDAAAAGCVIAVLKDVVECFEAVCSCDFFIGPNRVDANQAVWEGVDLRPYIANAIATVVRKTQLSFIVPIAITETRTRAAEALSTDQDIERAGWFLLVWAVQSRRLPELWPEVQAILLRWAQRSRLFREIEVRKGFDAALEATARMI